MFDPANFEVYDLSLGHLVGELLQKKAGGPDELPDDIRTGTLRVRLNRRVRAVELPMPTPAVVVTTARRRGTEYKHVLLLFHVAVEGPESWLGQRTREVGLEVRFTNFPGKVDSLAPAPDYVKLADGVSVTLKGRCWANADVVVDTTAILPVKLTLPDAGASGKFELSGQFQRTLSLATFATRVAATGCGSDYANWTLTRIGDDPPLAGRDHPFAALVSVPRVMEAIAFHARPSVTVTDVDRLHLYPITLSPEDNPQTPDGWWEGLVVFEQWPGQ